MRFLHHARGAVSSILVLILHYPLALYVVHCHLYHTFESVSPNLNSGGNDTSAKNDILSDFNKPTIAHFCFRPIKHNENLYDKVEYQTGAFLSHRRQWKSSLCSAHRRCSRKNEKHNSLHAINQAACFSLQRRNILPESDYPFQLTALVHSLSHQGGSIY